MIAWLAQTSIELPPFSGVMDALNSLLTSDIISGYLFWSLAAGLVGFVGYALIRMFRN